MHVADVGANVGYFSLLMADRVGSAGHVHAFEPNARLTGLLRRSAIVNGFRDRLTVHEVALGRTDGERLRLVMPDGEMGGGNVQPEAATSGGVLVDTRRMDGLPGMDRVSLVKIDAEGAEPAIWDGMAGMLAGDTLRTVLIEFTPGSYRDPGALLNRLMAPGFSLGIVDERDGVVPISRSAVLALPPLIGPMLVLRR
jgi:FkbM family methyltransferase